MGTSLANRQIERDRLRVQAELIQQLQENERRQRQLERIRADIARDLHDDIGGDLSSISMLSQAAGRQIARQPEQALATLQLIGESARQVLTNMRQIVWSLTESPAGGDVFASRFSEIARALFEYQDVELHLDFPPLSAGNLVSAPLKRAVFLAYKELLHNALRHSSACHIYVTLSVQESVLTLTVTDDGVGFSADDEAFSGNGLRSLQQRATDMGGTLKIRSGPGEGASLTLAWPLVYSVTSMQPA
jgi:signal transduction histidine kinase